MAESTRATGAAFLPARLHRLFGALVEGVTALHELGVVHRDLKPSNVLVCGTGDDELAKVVDFGFAKLAGMPTTFGAHVTVGDAGYAAPEQRQNARTGPSSDVFSLAAAAE